MDLTFLEEEDYSTAGLRPLLTENKKHEEDESILDRVNHRRSITKPLLQKESPVIILPRKKAATLHSTTSPPSLVRTNSPRSWVHGIFASSPFVVSSDHSSSSNSLKESISPPPSPTPKKETSPARKLRFDTAPNVFEYEKASESRSLSPPPPTPLVRSASSPLPTQLRTSSPNSSPTASPTDKRGSLHASLLGRSRKDSLKYRYTLHEQKTPEAEKAAISQVLYVKVRGVYDLPVSSEISGGKIFCNVMVEEYCLSTKEKKHRKHIQWEEEFIFTVKESTSVLTIEVCCQQNKKETSVIIAQVTVPVYSLERTQIYQDWFRLSSKESTHQPSSNQVGMGKIHLKLHYSQNKHSDAGAQYALENKYSELVGLLLQPSLALVHALSDVHDAIDSEELSAALVGLFQHYGQAHRLIHSTIERDVKAATDESSLFQNTPSIKFASFYCMAVGSQYLKDILSVTLNPVAESPLEYGSGYEIHPMKIPPNEKMEDNVKRLSDLVQKVVESICCSALACPAPIRNLVNSFRTVVTSRFSGDSWIRAVGRVLFVRFFSSAVVSPQDFGITTTPMHKEGMRWLIYVARILQNVGTGTLFDEHQRHLQPFNSLINKNFPLVKAYFTQVANLAYYVPPKEPATTVVDSNEVVLDALTIHQAIASQYEKIVQHNPSIDSEQLKDILTRISEDQQNPSHRL